MDDEFVAWEPCSGRAEGIDGGSARRSTETDSAAPSAPAGSSPPRARQKQAPLAPDRRADGPCLCPCRLCPCPSSSSSSCPRQARADLLSVSRLSVAWQGPSPCQHLWSGSGTEPGSESRTENDRDQPLPQHRSSQLQPLPLWRGLLLHWSVPWVACHVPPRPPGLERRCGPLCPPPDAEKETGSPRVADHPAAVCQLGASPS